MLRGLSGMKCEIRTLDRGIHIGRENWEPIAEQVQTFDEELVVESVIKMIHTGGHSDGHSIITIESDGERLVHMGDLMPTHAHQNVLWVLAYDDYPMDSIRAKEHWISAEY